MVARRIPLRPLLRFFYRASRKGLWPELKALLREALWRPRIANAAGPSPPVLFQLASGYWLSQAIYVAAKLGIADLLIGGSKSCDSLASATGSDPSALFRLLRALSSVGVFSQVSTNCFGLSPLARGLQSDAPGSLRAMVITIGEIHYQACGSLLHSVQTGSPAFNPVFGTSLFEYLQQNVEAADAFNGGMTNLSSMLAYAILMAYDFERVPSIVDVGGGEGKLLLKILEFNPKMKGTVFDLPAAIKNVRQEFNGNGCGGRCSYVAGDFFSSVPIGSDVYLLCGVIHDWDDTRAITILKNCRRAMTPEGRLLIVEMLVPESNSTSFSKLLDLNMLVMNGGRERTRSEFSTLLDAAGYRVARFIPTMAPQSIIEAVAQ